MYHPRNVLQRTNVVHSPKTDYNACSDFFQTLVEGHIIATTMEAFGTDKVNDTHNCRKASTQCQWRSKTMLYQAM